MAKERFLPKFNKRKMAAIFYISAKGDPIIMILVFKCIFSRSKNRLRCMENGLLQ